MRCHGGRSKSVFSLRSQPLQLLVVHSPLKLAVRETAPLGFSPHCRELIVRRLVCHSYFHDGSLLHLSAMSSGIMKSYANFLFLLRHALAMRILSSRSARVLALRSPVHCFIAGRPRFGFAATSAASRSANGSPATLRTISLRLFHIVSSHSVHCCSLHKTNPSPSAKGT